ncbi:MAG: hypothetical protein WD749_11275 [Phycisphaerales bacterium]
MSRERQNLSPYEAQELQRAAILRIVRAAFLVVLITVTVLSMLSFGPGSVPGPFLGLPSNSALILSLALAVTGIVLLIDLYTPRRRIGVLVGIFLGLIVAMLATVAVAYLIDALVFLYDIENPTLISVTKVLFGIGLSYLCITTVLQTQDDFRLVIPYVEFAKQVRGPRPLVLDSSALIDARIADLAQTGIIQYPVVIPRFVIAELQLLADSGDKLKRGRGRRGLEVISRLQRSALDLSIDETPVPGKAVDQMLVELARQMPATILTADVALGRVAAIHGVKVLNLNDVANALKPSLIPGEQLSIRLLKPGEQAGQAVGYLEDGTMVVAENGAGHIGDQVTLLVTSTLQTSAGRLIFGRLHADIAETPSVPAASDHSPSGGAGEMPAQPAEGAPASTSPTHAPMPHPLEPESAITVPPDRAPRAPRSPFPPKPPSRPNPARNPRR